MSVDRKTLYLPAGIAKVEIVLDFKGGTLLHGAHRVKLTMNSLSLEEGLKLHTDSIYEDVIQRPHPAIVPEEMRAELLLEGKYLRKPEDDRVWYIELDTGEGFDSERAR